MKRSALVLVASAALVVPTAGIAAPAVAGDPGGATVTNCSKTRHGVKVRVQLIDRGSFTRVRVSHPRGLGQFRNLRVRSIAADAGTVGGGGVSRPAEVRTSGLVGDKRSFSIPFHGPGTGVLVWFRLTNGKRITHGCSQQF